MTCPMGKGGTLPLGRFRKAVCGWWLVDGRMRDAQGEDSGPEGGKRALREGARADSSCYPPAIMRQGGKAGPDRTLREVWGKFDAD